MTMPYLVLMNDEEQYSLFLANKALPLGWKKVFGPETQENCLEYVNKTWLNIKPKRQSTRHHETTPRSRGVGAIAIVGMGCVFPESLDIQTFWENMIHGKDLISDIPHSHWLVKDYYDADPKAKDKIYSKRGAFLPKIDFDPMYYGIPPNTVPAIDSTQLLSLLVAQQVLIDVFGKDHHFNMDLDRVSVILGVTSAQELIQYMSSRLQRPIWEKALREAKLPEIQIAAICQNIANSYSSWQENTFPGLLGNVVAGRVANRFNLGGTNCVIDAACASTHAALKLAISELELGHTDMVISGGADTLNDIFMYMCFAKTGALSFQDECRPFDEAADGTLLGEGLAFFALKRLEDAERDNNKIYALIHSLAASSDGRTKSIYAPCSKGQAKAIRRCYERIGYTPDTVELIEAHGTGTKAGDAAELQGLQLAFREFNDKRKGKCAIGSIKSQMGHTKAAAGAAGLLKAVMALQHKVLPPTIKVTKPNTSFSFEDSPFYLNTEARPWVRGAAHPRRAAVSSFGFGGSNYHLTLEEYKGPLAAKRTAHFPSHLILLNCDTKEELIQECEKLLLELKNAHGSKNAKNISLFAKEKQLALQDKANERLAIVSKNTATLEQQLEQAISLLQTTNFSAKESFHPAGIYYGNQTISGKTAFLFPGQGSQYIGMGKDLALYFEEARSIWDELADIEFEGQTALHDIVFPVSVFTEEQRQAQHERLKETQWAQPALAAVSASYLKLLQVFGISADCCAGHSFGELTALYAAGAYSLENFIKIARKRGESLAEIHLPFASGMIAIHHPVNDSLALLEQSQLALSIANYNALNQLVVSADIKAIEKLEQLLTQQAIQYARLQVDRAFHWPAIAPAAEIFSQYLGGIDLKPLSMPVYANLSALPYENDPAFIKNTLVEQITNTVRFQNMIENMYQEGVRVFIEVGPQSVLSNLIKNTLVNKEIIAFSMDNKKQDGVSALWHSLAKLFIHGFSLEFSEFWKSFSLPEKHSKHEPNHMILEINGTCYGKPYPQPEDIQTIKPELSEPRTEQSQAPTCRGSSAASMLKQRCEQTVDAADKPRHVGGWGKEITTNILNIVAEKTGYPADMLDKTMAMEADLGIDSIKRVEILSEVQEKIPNLPPMDTAAMAELQTIDDVIHYIESTQQTSKTPDQTETRTEQSQAPTCRGSSAASMLKQRCEQTVDAADKPRHVGGWGKEITTNILNIVAEKTGYPADMLDKTMAMEADLGIDSIKRVEILSEVQEKIPNLPPMDTAAMAELQTIDDVIHYIESTQQTSKTHLDQTEPRPIGSGNFEPASDTTETLTTPAIEEHFSPGIGRYLLEASSSPATPKAPLQNFSSNKKIIIVPDNIGIAEALKMKLEQNGNHVFLSSNPTDTEGAFSGLIYLKGLSSNLSSKEHLEINRHSFEWARFMANNYPLDSAFFVSAQDTGGYFGLKACDPVQIYSSGLPGLVKTMAHEWHGAGLKAIDIAKDAYSSKEEIAERIFKELAEGGNDIEVGLPSSDARLLLQSVPVHRSEQQALPLQAGDVLLVSGGARGITAACLIALAKKHPGLKFVLLGRTNLEEEQNLYPDISQEHDLKMRLIEEAKQQGENPSPQGIHQKIKNIFAIREIKNSLRQLEQAQASSYYFSVDVQSLSKTEGILQQLINQIGPISGFIHAAGVLRDKRIKDKSNEQFDEVFNTKVLGLENLLDALRGQSLKLMVFFSSVAARFGNEGQCDYAMANEIMNKLAQKEQRERGTACLVKSINWGPWESGMVSAELKALFAKKQIHLLSVEEGSRLFVNELEKSDANKNTVEVILGSQLMPISERSFGSPSLRAVLRNPVTLKNPNDTGLLHDTRKDGLNSQEFLINEKKYPFLKSHRIKNITVVPACLVLEWFVQACKDIFGDEAFVLENFKIQKGIQLKGEEDEKALILSVQAVSHGGLPNFHLDLKGLDNILHYQAEAQSLSACDKPSLNSMEMSHALNSTTLSWPFSVNDIYDGKKLFHGFDFQVIQSLDSFSEKGGSASFKKTMQADNLNIFILDGCLQLLRLWAYHAFAKPSLPIRIGRCILHNQKLFQENTGFHCIFNSEKKGSYKTLSEFLLMNEQGVLAVEMQDVEMCIYDDFSRQN